MLSFDWRIPVLAVQFLTRLPTPQVRDFKPELLAGAVGWFPAVGLLIGILLLIPVALLAPLQPWLAALVGLVGWAWITGGLHLDGLADLADGLGAAHRDPERFLAVVKDPHLGSFGVLALLLQCAAKLVLLMLVCRLGHWWLLILVPAWARWGVFSWQTLPPLAPGMAEQFGWQRGNAAWFWTGLLVAMSLLLAPPLLIAPLIVWAYRRWLKRRLGGVSGDCLGAGIELTETALLLTGVLAVLLHGLAI
ncbi:adenosylcobinamide-GDP ribazoletransferase [Jeongeupia naejangsanensis]|uniref:Adenosylcobinamide-GDP ribazoletransferase n=1 Tax=Jeongeupia naejangsanensis TaxID=613195 RepID=A0ABS2BPH8_9NEIS|nr:adenosylcobinamide-GDP ribazoletransferase [Jeongeupia naejangsanensis]MBM3117527.1 adenosylcobinamide-GDP ribazoletransferase [Jeongeupia naejangsanensis]